MRLIANFSIMLVLAVLAGGASAQDADNNDAKLKELIDAVVQAYGGDALRGIRNYQISERYVAPATGQSWTPQLDNVGSTTQKLVHDVEGERLYFENWFAGRSGIFSGATLVNGDSAWTMNYMAGTYGDAASNDPYAIAGGTMRTTDTLLALELEKARGEASYVGSENFMNRPHEKVSIPFPQSPELTLYIDAETKMISRMTRENPQLGHLDYVFKGHFSKNGIARARSSNFLVAGRPNLIGSEREILFNQRIEDAQFERPAELEREGERLDTSEMMANKLSGNAYHVGQGGGFSFFVDTGNGIVAAGGYPGLKQRLARFREETGSHQPLAYQVVTHHHQDHIAGIAEALDLGARLVTVSENVEAIEQATNGDPEAGRFLRVDQQLTLGSGNSRVEVYRVSTLHAASYLLMYAPGSRTLFVADHFGGPYADGIPTANANTASLHQALAPLKLNYNKLVTAHNGRVYSSRDLEKSVAAYREQGCPQKYPLCVEM